MDLEQYVQETMSGTPTVVVDICGKSRPRYVPVSKRIMYAGKFLDICGMDVDPGLGVCYLECKYASGCKADHCRQTLVYKDGVVISWGKYTGVQV